MKHRKNSRRSNSQLLNHLKLYTTKYLNGGGLGSATVKKTSKYIAIFFNSKNRDIGVTGLKTKYSKIPTKYLNLLPQTKKIEIHKLYSHPVDHDTFDHMYEV